MLETLFLMLMIGGKQGGKSIHGLDSQTLPEHLARQAVHLFSKSSIQFFTQVAQTFTTVVSDLIVRLMHPASSSFRCAAYSALDVGMLISQSTRLDGAPLFNSVKPVVVYRLLRCIALVAYNNTNFRYAEGLRNHGKLSSMWSRVA